MISKCFESSCSEPPASIRIFACFTRNVGLNLKFDRHLFSLPDISTSVFREKLIFRNSSSIFASGSYKSKTPVSLKFSSLCLIFVVSSTSNPLKPFFIVFSSHLVFFAMKRVFRFLGIILSLQVEQQLQYNCSHIKFCIWLLRKKDYLDWSSLIFSSISTSRRFSQQFFLIKSIPFAKIVQY